MKTFKKLTAFVLAIVMCVALCSCTFSQSIKIKANGKVTTLAKYTLSETEIKDLEVSLDDKTAFDEFIKESNKKGLTETIDGVKYYSSVEEAKFDSVEEINSTLTSAGEYTTTDFWAYANGSQSEASAEYDAVIKETGIAIHFVNTITFPYKVVETNCEKTDDYTITYGDGYEGMFVYAITEKSTADWTRAEDKDAAIKEMAKKQYTPKKIKGLKVVYKNAKSLKVSWAMPESLFVSGYKIERKVGNGAWAQIKDAKFLTVKTDMLGNPYFVDKKVKVGKTYSYRVKAYYQDSEFNVEGKYSKVKTVKFTNINKAPTFKLKVKGKTAVVKIKNFDKAVNGYQIKYSSNKNFKRAKTVNTKTAKATIKGLDTTKAYYVKVRKFVKGTNNNVYGKFSKVSKIINV